MNKASKFALSAQIRKDRISEVKINIRPYASCDLPGMIRVWNEVVDAGTAFPQTEVLTEENAPSFFAAQSHCGVAEDADEYGTQNLLGLYILHPNNIGRCGHIANASFAVTASARGLGIGRKLVMDCLGQCRCHDFSILQFNAVVESNLAARKLYEDLGFTCLGTIPNGFRAGPDLYRDICVYYREA